MKNYIVKNFLMLFSAMMISSCAGNENTLNTVPDTEDIVYADEVLPVKGKLNVYSSMARAVKFNVDPAVKTIHRKLLAKENAQSPREALRNILNVKTNGENQLYDSVRILDFAVMYAMSVLSTNSEYIDSNLYAKSAQNLALNAISAHKDALYAQRKIKEVDRFLARENKTVENLNKKLVRNGVLNKDDQELKKGTEVVIYKLTAIRRNLEEMMHAYRRLVKVDEEAVLEGRHFYELEDFDEKNQLVTFQNAGLKNRSEFEATAAEGRRYTMSEVKENAIKRYPEIETLNLNGYNIKDALYIDRLQRRASKIADNLLIATEEYRKAKEPADKIKWQNKAFDEVGVAVLAQIEIDYDIVRMADADFGGISDKIIQLRKEIKTLERHRNLPVSEKISLLDKKVELIQLELRESQISAERAVALRSLYFHSGLSPFNRRLVRADAAGIEENLKISFNRDMVEMLAQAKSIKTAPKKNEGEWAKEENWLEELIDNPAPKTNKPVTTARQPAGDFEPYIGEKFNKLKIMQLGAYRERGNADLEWKMLKELYPQLTAYTPKVESNMQNGRRMYRLILKSPSGGFTDLCNKLRADRVECLLR